MLLLNCERNTKQTSNAFIVLLAELSDYYHRNNPILRVSAKVELCIVSPRLSSSRLTIGATLVSSVSNR